MTKANRKELINAATRAWLAVASPVRAVRELADEIGLNLSDSEVSGILIEAMDAS